MKLPNEETISNLIGIGLAAMSFGLAALLFAFVWLIVKSGGC